jgi:hypothetical protein
VVTRERASKAGRERPRPVGNVYGVSVPENFHEAIELERDNLSKVESLLACMVASMECQSSPLSGPCYPDVVQIARELVERSINNLDPFILKRRLLDKVGEGFCMSVAKQTYVRLHRLDSRQVLIGSFAQCG